MVSTKMSLAQYLAKKQAGTATAKVDAGIHKVRNAGVAKNTENPAAQKKLAGHLERAINMRAKAIETRNSANESASEDNAAKSSKHTSPTSSQADGKKPHTKSNADFDVAAFIARKLSPKTKAAVQVAPPPPTPPRNKPSPSKPTHGPLHGIKYGRIEKRQDTRPAVANALPKGTKKPDCHRVARGLLVPISSMNINGWRPVKKLSEDKESSVWHAENPDKPNEPLAIKLPKDKYRFKWRKAFVSEIKANKRLAEKGIPHVVRYRYYSLDTEGENGLYLCTQLMDGNADQYFARFSDRNPHKEVFLMIAQIARALEALEGISMVHGNVRPENIFYRREKLVIDKKGNTKEKVRWYLGNFSSATQAYSLNKPAFATMPWMAPELARPGATRVAPNSDVYSLFVVMMLLMNWDSCRDWAIRRPEDWPERIARAVKGNRHCMWWSKMAAESDIGRASAAQICELLKTRKLLTMY